MSRASDNATIAAIFGGVAFVIAAVGGSITASAGINPLMTDFDGAVRTVEQAGFKDAKATGYGWFKCGIGEHADWWRTRFTATNQNGQEVTGVVCSSIFKGSTIRFD